MANPAKSKTVLAALAEYEYVIMELSEATQRGYKQHLNRFARWCQEKRLYVRSLTPAIIAQFIQEIRQQALEKTGDPLSSYTLSGYMRDIRAFLYWCARSPQRYVSIELPQNLLMPKVDSKIIVPFSKEQIQRLQVAAGQNTHFPIMAARDKAILAVLLDTGIRALELCSLTLSNVHLAGGPDAYLKIRGKGRREREVPLGKKSRQLLGEYIKRYRPPAESQIVFLSHRGEPLTTNALRQIFKRWSRRAGITGVRCSPHDCRHTFALNFLLQGGDLYVLSRLLGHASVSITEVYLRAVEALQARKMAKSVLDNL